MDYARFRELCLAMPEAEEVETWGDATFRVRGRIFAISAPEARHASVKASLDDQAGLVRMDPRTFEVAAYTGRFGWVRVRLAGLGERMGRELVRNAWERTAPRRLVASRTPAGGSRGRRTAARSTAGSRRR